MSAVTGPFGERFEIRCVVLSVMRILIRNCLLTNFGGIFILSRLSVLGL